MNGKLEAKLFVRRAISWLLVLLCMAVIFVFSSQSLEKSSEISDRFTEVIFGETDPEFFEKYEIETEENTFTFVTLVRKTAHFLIFMLLGFLMMNALYTYELKKGTKLWVSLAVTSLYASSDEIHQLFSDQRGCQFADVLLDTAGGVVGIFLFVAVICLYKKFISRSR